MLGGCEDPQRKIVSPVENLIFLGDKSYFPKMHTNVFIVPNNKRLNKKNVEF